MANINEVLERAPVETCCCSAGALPHDSAYDPKVAARDVLVHLAFGGHNFVQIAFLPQDGALHLGRVGHGHLHDAADRHLVVWDIVAARLGWRPASPRCCRTTP